MQRLQADALNVTKNWYVDQIKSSWNEVDQSYIESKSCLNNTVREKGPLSINGKFTEYQDTFLTEGP
jgi:hypothetical protein